MIDQVIGASVRAALLGVGLWLCASAQALPLTYVESNNGELAKGQWTATGVNPGEGFFGASSTPLPTTLPALSAGSNTISGTASITGHDFNAASYDRDGFFFTLGTGQTVSSFSVALDSTAWVIVTKLQGNGNYLALGQFYNGFSSGEMVIGTVSTPTNIVLPTSGEGTYAVTIRNAQGGTSTLNYTFTIDIVPEPAALLLLAAGVAVLCVRRRRRAA